MTAEILEAYIVGTVCGMIMLSWANIVVCKIKGKNFYE